MRKPALVLAIFLPACAHVDPLGSPQQKPREPGVEYAGDFPVEAGWICRELQGRAKAHTVDGQGRGGRCQRIGKGELAGCFRFTSDRVEFQSSGCFQASSPTPAKLDELAEQLDALESEFEAFIKGEK